MYSTPHSRCVYVSSHRSCTSARLCLAPPPPPSPPRPHNEDSDRSRDQDNNHHHNHYTDRNPRLSALAERHRDVDRCGRRQLWRHAAPAAEFRYAQTRHDGPGVGYNFSLARAVRRRHEDGQDGDGAARGVVVVGYVGRGVTGPVHERGCHLADQVARERGRVFHPAAIAEGVGRV
jgi:hypothetical protein